MSRRLLATIPLAALLVLLSAAPGAGAASLDRLLAPTSACRGQLDRNASARAQERAMVCLTNYARRAAGLSSLRPDDELESSAARKSGDILRCDDFSHFACERDFTFWMRRVGYISASCWRAGENIAWGTGSLGTVRSIFDAWLHSPGHRENILSPSYGHIGIGLRVGDLDRYRGARVWTQHFGKHC